MAIFLDRAFGLGVGQENGFRDISPDMTSYQSILNVAASGIASGYPDNTYRPNQPVTRGQFSAFMARALGLVTIPENRDLTNLVDQQLEVVKNKEIPGYQFYQAYPIHFTGKDIPEIVVSSYGFEQGNQDYIDKSLLQVYQYNEGSKTWEVSNSFKDSGKDYSYRPLSYITKGKLLDDQKEQLVVGYVWGSDFVLTPIVYGSTDGKTVKALMTVEEQALPNGIAVIKDKELFLTNHLFTVAERYVFENGEFVRYIGTGADDRKLAGAAEHILVLEKRNGIPYLSGERNLTMKVGESFSIIRGDENDTSQDYIYRLYFDNLNKVTIAADGGVLKAVKPETFELGILLDGSYGAGFDIKITVVE